MGKARGWRVSLFRAGAAFTIGLSGWWPAYGGPFDVFTADFVIDVPDGMPPGPAATKSGKELMTVQIRHPRAVKLLDEVDPETAKSMEASPDYPLRPGQILVGLADYGATYCALLETRGLGAAAPCLEDRDHDGKFDAIRKAGFDARYPDTILMNRKFKLVGVHLSAVQPLPHPIAYQTISYRDAPAVTGKLVWREFSKNSVTGVPGKIALWLEGGDDSTGTAVLSRPLVFFPSKTNLLDVDGIRLHLLGFDPDGAIRWEAAEPATSQKVAFGFRPRQQTIYVYIRR